MSRGTNNKRRKAGDKVPSGRPKRMRKPAHAKNPSPPPPQEPDCVVSCRIRPDTINMIEILATFQGQDPVKVSQLPFLGNEHPNVFARVLNVAIESTTRAISVTHSARAGIDTNSASDACREAVEAVSKYLRNAIVDASGKKQVKTDPDGAIQATTTDDVEIENAPKPLFILDDEVVEDAEDSVSENGNEADEEFEDEDDEEDGYDAPPPSPGRGGRLITP